MIRENINLINQETSLSSYYKMYLDAGELE